MSKITAQVAVEAIVNSPEDYELSTMTIVFADALDLGVAKLYQDMLAEVIRNRMPS